MFGSQSQIFGIQQQIFCVPATQGFHPIPPHQVAIFNPFRPRSPQPAPFVSGRVTPKLPSSPNTKTRVKTHPISHQRPRRKSHAKPISHNHRHHAEKPLTTYLKIGYILMEILKNLIEIFWEDIMKLITSWTGTWDGSLNSRLVEVTD